MKRMKSSRRRPLPYVVPIPFLLAVCASLVIAQDGPAPPVPAPSLDPVAQLEAAQRALDAGAWEEAMAHYESIRSLMPRSAQLPYNMGVAAYRAGDMDRAAEYFEQAMARADDPSLAARSAYNLGTTAYARSQQPPTGEAAVSPQDQMKRAEEQLGEAIEHFRTALDLDPQDRDARANAEWAQRLLQQLQEMQQQQQPQSSPDGEDGEQGDEGEPPPEGTDSAPQEGPPGENDAEEGPPPPDGQEPAPSPADAGEQSPSEPPAETPPPPEAGAEADDTAAEDETAGEEEEEEPRQMSRAEAERLLQGVRDRERRRREELERAEQRRRTRVDKDW